MNSQSAPPPTQPVRSVRPVQPVRRIAHLDMDAYFASVELLRYPQLRGQPVAVGGRGEHHPRQLADGRWQYARLRDYVGRGVLTTASYEARALGLHSGMGTMKAAQLAPEAILLPADFAAYRHYSRLFKAAVRRITPLVEDRGIDEIYIDLSALPDDTLTLARRLKQAVLDATGLTCSIGIAPNKLLAKLCSEFDKPDGISVLQQADIAHKVWPLPVHRINGIGPKAAQKLKRLGISSIAELAAAQPAWLMTHFGRSSGAWLHAAAHGIDERPLVTSSTPKSVSRETTFERDLHARSDRQLLGSIFTELCQRVAADLARHQLLGRTVGIKLRYADFRTLTRDLTLPQATADAATIRQAAGQCLKRAPLEQKLRLLGVRVSALCRPEAEIQAGGVQEELPLF